MKRKQKNDFISKLAFYLSFHYSDEEQKSIINDYDDWFKNEMGMGKEYAQVCEELGTPRKIVNNLLSEESKRMSNIHMIFNNVFIHYCVLLILHFIISTFLIYVMNRSGINYLYSGIALMGIYFILELIYSSGKKVNDKGYSDGIFVEKNIVLFCFVILFFMTLIFIIPKINYVQSGRILSFAANLFIAGIIIFSIYECKNNIQYDNGLCTFIFHVLGVITIIFYIKNQLGMRYDSINKYNVMILKGLIIYIETILMCTVLHRKAL